MFVRAKKKDDQRWQVQIVESVRAGSSIKQKIIRNIGTAYSEKELEEFKKIGETAIIHMKNAVKPVLPFFDPADFHAPRKRKKQTDQLVDPKNLREEKRINEGYTDIFSQVFKESGFSSAVTGTKMDVQWNRIIESLVVARIAAPKSKLATAQYLESQFDIKIPFSKIYRALDALVKNESKVKTLVAQTTFGMFPEPVDVLFFDVTTLYFESICSDELKAFGFSKDCKFKEVQVVLALVTTKEGLPVTYKLFPGNTFEGHTLKQVIVEMKQDFSVDQFMFVADRGMFSKENLDLMDAMNIKYIVAAKLKSLPADIKNEILTQDFSPTVIQDEFHWIRDFKHQNRRLVVSYSSKRAHKDSHDRQRLVDRLLKKVKDKKIRVSDLISNRGTKKFIDVHSGHGTVNEKKIADEASWDGLHGVITNDHSKSAKDVLERYRGLWQIEEAFRVNKHSLKMRPIFHWTPKRIQAHILLCFMAFAVAKYSLARLKKREINLSLEELNRHLGQAQASIVRDLPSNSRYVIPSQVTTQQKHIYAAFGLKRNDKPFAIH